ncbi:hypothetical protein [Leucobacter chironomi]|uniref:hypothetical protein n=1 Tax=Leucobacter chironomi TaxID=491918 RepID=UPI000410D214|nr:hypothetical protein [Leucobacter chironomi]
MVLGLDPVLTLFSWFSGLAVAALLSLYVLASIGTLRYLRRSADAVPIWQSTIAPLLAAIGFGGFLLLVIGNFTELIGDSVVVAAVLLAAVPVAFVVGMLADRGASERSSSRSRTEVVG